MLTHDEVERALAQCNLSVPLGLRDRALLELLYSTGLRRTEAIGLTLPDVDLGRQVVFVCDGKGARDRVVPIGQRALRWVDRYLLDARPQLVVPPDPDILFLTRRGKPLPPNRLAELVHRYLSAAKLGKEGSCHGPLHPRRHQHAAAGAPADPSGGTAGTTRVIAPSFFL